MRTQRTRLRLGFFFILMPKHVAAESPDRSVGAFCFNWASDIFVKFADMHLPGNRLYYLCKTKKEEITYA